MPRNNSGEYSLPEAAFVPGTVISSAAVNEDFSDIATALTQSLATTGVSTMTGAILAAQGSVGEPSYTFSSGTSNGMFLASTNELGFSTDGTLAVTINDDQSVTFEEGITVSGNLTVDGTSTLTGATTIDGSLTIDSTSYIFGSPSDFWTGLAPTGGINWVMGNGVVPLEVGWQGPIWVPYNLTLTYYTAYCNESCTIEAGVGTDTGLLTASPNNNTVSGSLDTAMTAGETIQVQITSVSNSPTNATLFLQFTRTGN